MQQFPKMFKLTNSNDNDVYFFIIVFPLYQKDTLERINEHTMSRIDELPPDRWLEDLEKGGPKPLERTPPSLMLSRQITDQCIKRTP